MAIGSVNRVATFYVFFSCEKVHVCFAGTKNIGLHKEVTISVRGP